jgi:hypothetical protein
LVLKPKLKFLDGEELIVPVGDEGFEDHRPF